LIIHDYSYGVIPLQKIEGEFVVLLIQQHQGYWTFPKGHPEEIETHLETATRELKEETGLNILKFVYNEPIQEQYVFSHNKTKIQKSVSYFLALVEGDLKLQQEEILSAKWVKLVDAPNLITYPEAKAVCKQVIEILNSLQI